MKKTLILGAFAALVGSSYAVDPFGTIKVTEGNSFAFVDAKGDSISGFTVARAGTLTSTSVEDNSYTTSQNGWGASPVFAFARIDGLTMENFSVSFTATWSGTQNYINLLGFGEVFTNDQNNKYNYKIWVNGENADPQQWSMTKVGYSDSPVLTNVTPSAGFGDTSKSHTYLFSLETPADSTRVFSLYEDGKLMFTSTVTQNFGAAHTFYLSVGGSVDADRGPNGTFSDIKVYNSAVTPKDLVPEPATATLSLLALAGLAARRRRK